MPDRRQERVAKLDQKEYGAYQATCRLGKFESMGFGPLTPFLEPDNFLFGQYYTGEPRNRSHVADPALDDLLVRQRRPADLKARRDVMHQIQRHLAKQQYYVHAPTGVYIAVWDGALKNYGPNLGFDYGGRLAAAWLDRCEGTGTTCPALHVDGGESVTATCVLIATGPTIAG
jgi:ABC-type transport system substrate-binding protein